MAALDFVQFRWQHIRQAEAIQVIQRENISLKQQLAVAQAQLNERPKQSGVDKASMLKVNKLVASHISRSRADYMSLKQYYLREMDGLQLEKAKLSKSFDVLQTAFEVQRVQLDLTQRELRATKCMNEELHRKSEENEGEQAVAMRKLREKISSTEDALEAANHAQQGLHGEISRLKKELKGAYKAVDEASSRVTQIEEEIKEHHQVHERTLLEMAEAASEARRVQRRTVEHYDQIVDELEVENDELRKVISEQQAQITKLTNAAIGNKSHFAKYIEVKTENLTLQSKLEEVTTGKHQPPSGAAALRRRRIVDGVGSGSGGGGGGGGGTIQKQPSQPSDQRRPQSPLSFRRNGDDSGIPASTSSLAANDDGPKLTTDAGYLMPPRPAALQYRPHLDDGGSYHEESDRRRDLPPAGASGSSVTVARLLTDHSPQVSPRLPGSGTGGVNSRLRTTLPTTGGGGGGSSTGTTPRDGPGVRVQRAPPGAVLASSVRGRRPSWELSDDIEEDTPPSHQPQFVNGTIMSEEQEREYRRAKRKQRANGGSGGVDDERLPSLHQQAAAVVATATADSNGAPVSIKKSIRIIQNQQQQQQQPRLQQSSSKGGGVVVGDPNALSIGRSSKQNLAEAISMNKPIDEQIPKGRSGKNKQ